jgi:DNA-binding CsgD family transcriptional regulator
MAPLFVDRSIVCPIMVGRDLPTQALLRLFERAKEGQGQIALVSGEAGIGKSRLVREMKAQLQMGVQVLQGNCFEADQMLPYASITDLLRGYFAPPASQNKPLFSTEFLRLLPEFSHYFTHIHLPTEESDQEKHRLHGALIQLVSDLSLVTPLIVIVEDVHWCDDASLEFLLLLVRRLTNLHVLLVLTYRDDEISPALATFLAQLDRERLTTEFRLPRLTAEGVGRMVSAIFELERQPRSEFVGAIHNLSEGNPFFIEEILKSLVAAGDIFLTDGKWERKPLEELHIPRTVQLSLRQRLSQLSPPTREVLSIAAVAGKRFDFVLLQYLTGIPEAELIRIIHELKDAQFVVEENVDIFAFRHALTRQAVYQEMFQRERRTLHRKIAEATETLYGSPAHNTSLPDLAYHYFQAEAWEKATQFGWEAGQYAEALHAPRAAIEHYSHAIAAYKHLGTNPPLQLLRSRGKAFEISGNFAAARDDYVCILEAARTTEDYHYTWQSLFDLGFLYTGLDFAMAGRYLGEAIEAARTLNDPTALAESLNRIGNWYMNQNLPMEALPYHREALNIFEALNDLKGRAETLDLLGVTGVVAGDLVSSAAYYDQAIPLFRHLDNRLLLSSALSVTSIRGGNCMSETVYCPPTGLDFLVDTAEEARRIASSIGWQHGEAAADMYVGYGLVLQGEFELGLTCARRGIQLASVSSHTLFRAASEMALGRLYNELFAFEDAQEVLESALQTAKDISGKFVISSIGGFLASTYIGLNEPQKAAHLIAELSTEQMQSVGQRILRCAEAELALAQGDAEGAIGLIDHLIHTAPSSQGRVIPRLWHMKAEALLLLGDTDSSRILLQEAADSAEVGNLKALLWRILASRGKLENLSGNTIEAGSCFEAAQDLLQTLVARLTDTALQAQFLARASADFPQKAPVTPRQAAKKAFDGLTEREREIAILIAGGKTSREIAEQLVLSKRTVDAHTANILSKLGFSSRIQIARWALDKGLL